MQGNRLALLLSLAHRQHWSHHFHFTPQAVSHGANDVSVCSLIPCTPARALLSATTLRAAGRRSSVLGGAQPLPERVTCGGD